jgi:hypothetical protein
MADKNPHENSDNELLSAFIDGELTAAERAAVERRLQDDPQARAMVSELRTVSQTLLSLPKQELGTDLREAVLQQAVVRAEQAPVVAGGARRWAWAALALAAALLLTAYLPETDHDQPRVAQAPADEPGKTLSASSSPLQFSLDLLAGSDETQEEASQRNEAVRFTVGATFDGTLSQTPVESPISQTIGKVIAEEYHVHLTPVDRRVSTAQFDQVLAKHGIAVRGQSDAGDKQRMRRASEPLANQTELVLVEASLEQIQQIVASCGEDDSRWKLPPLVDQEGADSISLFFARQKPKSDSPAEEGVAVVLDDLRPSDAPAQGWAKHLGQDRVVVDDSFSNESDSSPDKQTPTLRVIFVLHPAAE